MTTVLGAVYDKITWTKIEMHGQHLNIIKLASLFLSSTWSYRFTHM
jgi:hypothetical protein